MNPVPNNSELEQRLLSALFFGAEEVNAAVSDGLVAEAFYVPANRALFEALRACAAEDRSTEIEVVWRRLTGLSGDGAGVRIAEIARVQGLEPTSLRRQSLTVDVLGLWRQRRLLDALAAAREAALTPAASFVDVWEAAEPHLRAASDVMQDNRRRKFSEIAEAAAKSILSPDPRKQVPTPFPVWDRAATAPRGGQMIVIAGRPGTGKTALAVEIADFIAAGDRIVAFVSLEMSGEELITRIALQRGGADCAGTHPKSRAALAAKIQEVGRMRSLQLFEVKDAVRLEQIEASARLLASAPRGLSAIFVDYLQLVQPPADSRRDIREQQVAQMSRRLKLLALSLDVPVFVLAQLNRESEKDDRKPRLSDLRESGAIEQDADRVWFLYAKDNDPTVFLYQAKCRNGPAGIEAPFTFNRPIFKFIPQ